jgi:membrane protein
VKHAKSDRVSIVAGSLAYRWFLSLFPTLIVLLGITSLLQLPASTVRRLIHGATVALPAGASSVVTRAIAHAHGRTAGGVAATAIAAAVALYSATSGMAAVEEGLDMAYDVPADRKFLKKRLVALELMVAVALLGGAAAALVVFGPQIGRAINGAVPVAGFAFVAGWTAVRWVAAIVLVTVLFAFIYWRAPNRDSPRWHWLTPGSIFAGAVWLAASLGFSYYTSSFGSYGKTYGAFAGVVILILWLYITGAVMLLGAEINAELERRREQRTDARLS